MRRLQPKRRHFCCAEGDSRKGVTITLSDGTREVLPVVYTGTLPGGAEAAVHKYAGEDPDVTDNTLIIVRLNWSDKNVEFCAGEGVGIITKPGLALPPASRLSIPVQGL